MKPDQLPANSNIESALNTIARAIGELAPNTFDPEGAYQTYTPTFTNITVGNGTLIARYIQQGKVVTVDVWILAGTTTSFANGIVISLPVAANTRYTSANFAPIGKALAIDTAVAGFMGTVLITASTTEAIVRWDLSIAGGGFSSTFPFTEGSTDGASFTFQYEAA